MRLGIICPSEIALRRFMPALQDIPELEFVGIAVSSAEERFGTELPSEEETIGVLNEEKRKAQVFVDQYGGVLFESYREIVESDEIDALYVPLPPALHFKWAELALSRGKHVLVEKPATTNAGDSRRLVDLARANGLALHENYMFVYHKQLEEINQIVASGEIGDVRLYRISFGFPLRASNDFRYNKALGGGALIDAGGYTLRYASLLLGASARTQYAQMNYLDGYAVDMYGSAALTNDEGVEVQVSFGMDNGYKCELEVWGSKGCLTTNRVLTAPVGFAPDVTIEVNGEKNVRKLPSDDSFGKSIRQFIKGIQDDEVREKDYQAILKQAELVDEFRALAVEGK